MNTKTIEFAKEELAKYLSKLGVETEITLGLFDEYNIKTELKDPKQDDAIAISVKDKKGYIAGSNERSVLIAVYRFLEEWGMGWIRPGCDIYPDACNTKDVEILESAYMRHRIICIEGACSVENILDMIDWLPKMGFNGYYLQFTSGYEFYERYYTHKFNKFKEPEDFTGEMAEKYTAEVISQIKKRGLIFQRYGHGWNCTSFGIPDKGWHRYEYDQLPKSYHDICALVNGKRECWEGAPLETQLCYTNPVVKEALVNEVIKRTREDPDTDVLHFWLGDKSNNCCECEECTKGNYTDTYVELVNAITDRMCELGIDKKIIFLAYLNTSYPPQKSRIKHPDKAILMFAPITRNFGEAFPDGYRIKEIPEYKLNAFSKPTAVDECLAYLYGWRKVFDGDAVDFDYHLMWDHWLDASEEGIARVLHEDIKHFDSLGLNGFISCQNQRVFFPTSVAMTVMARTLWNKDADFDEIRRKLYSDIFGEEYADEMSDYFAFLAKNMNIGIMRRYIKYDPEELKAEMTKAQELMNEMKKKASERKIAASDPCRKYSWEVLEHHAHIYTLLAKAVVEKLSGNTSLAREYNSIAREYAFEKEDILQPVLDSYFFQEVGWRMHILDD